MATELQRTLHCTGSTGQKNKSDEWKRNRPLQNSFDFNGKKELSDVQGSGMKSWLHLPSCLNPDNSTSRMSIPVFVDLGLKQKIKKKKKFPSSQTAGFGIYSKGNGPPNQPAGTFPNENTSLLQACSHSEVSTWLRKQGEKGIPPDFSFCSFSFNYVCCFSSNIFVSCSRRGLAVCLWKQFATTATCNSSFSPFAKIKIMRLFAVSHHPR